jgi:hypothetical protein
MISRAKRFANGLMKDYQDVQVVKDFYEEVNPGGDGCHSEFCVNDF